MSVSSKQLCHRDLGRVPVNRAGVVLIDYAIVCIVCMTHASALHPGGAFAFARDSCVDQGAIVRDLRGVAAPSVRYSAVRD